MLPNLLVRRHINFRTCISRSAHAHRDYSNGPSSNGHENTKQPKTKRVKDAGTKGKEHAATAKPKEPTLFEQLFPDQQKQPDAPKKRPQEVPRVHTPYELPPTTPQIRFQLKEGPAHLVPRAHARRRQAEDKLKEATNAERTADPDYLSPRALAARRVIEAEDAASGPIVSVLVLRNASKNLVEDDFRRLIPRGRHMEGWKLEQGDILKVIPARDWQTLARESWYYILFPSRLSAYTYQGYATRLFNLVSQHTPRNMLSPILPPPGEIIMGIDANEAIQSFTLCPPNASLDLRQLKPPLTPFVQALVENRGYRHLLTREDHSPYEARLTLEGPQMHGSSIHHLFLVSGKDRGLSWSGSDDPAPKVTEWNPDVIRRAPSEMSYNKDAYNWKKRIDHSKFEDDLQEQKEVKDDKMLRRADADFKKRTAQKIFIVGFATETAMQSFVRFWHKRPMEWKGFNKHYGVGDEGDLPAVAHVEAL